MLFITQEAALYLQTDLTLSSSNCGSKTVGPKWSNISLLLARYPCLHRLFLACAYPSTDFCSCRRYMFHALVVAKEEDDFVSNRDPVSQTRLAIGIIQLRLLLGKATGRRM
jgi:hypothetical protein